MISQDEYIFLKELQKSDSKNENLFVNENEQMILDLIHNNYINHKTFDDDYSISKNGKHAIEEYERNQRKDKIDEEQLVLAKKELKQTKISNFLNFIGLFLSFFFKH